ncbi:MAG: HIT family protein [Ignavibacteria bacterium]|nr:HIT family protein [Ignavibacteria bacterium]MBI3766038.1 HIT family protein [Ignavibacteriales bacterium]
MIHCEFCKIVRGNSSAEILYDNLHAIAILDINPIHYGHILVIPKTHCATFLEVPEEELSDLICATKIVSRAMVDSLNPPGFNIFSNNGRAAGQSVFHFHFHVTPRYDDDNIQFVLKLKKYGEGEMTNYGERIRRHINTNLDCSIL